MRLNLNFIPNLLCLCLSVTLSAQISTNDWNLKQENLNINKSQSNFEELPNSYLIANISIDEFSSKLKSKDQEIQIPNPNGNFETFIISPTQVMPDENKHLFSIQTFRGYSKNDPSVMIACDISSQGFHAAVFQNKGSYFIEPASKVADSKHIVFHKSDNSNPVKCLIDQHQELNLKREITSRTAAPNTKRDYKLALVAAGEYSQQFGGSPYNVMNVMNAMASGINTINVIYIRDLGVEFELVSTNNLVFPNPSSDPFNTANQSGMLDQCQIECDNELGSGGYDIGHLLVWADLGGLAATGVICNDVNKAKAFSGVNSSYTTFWVDYVCHEIGHQFGAPHNFSSQECGTSEANFRYEPGEGSSIMSYANVCGPAPNYAPGSDPFFHYSSIVPMIDEMVMWGTCATTSSAGNSSDPAVNAQSNLTIPKQTPFILVGSATDANDGSGPLTYNWEQYDGSGSATTGSPNCTSTNGSMFRYRPPVSDNFRYFPPYTDVLNGNNNSVTWEKLPCVARTMNFSMAVRDNNTTFGRVVHDQMVVTVANTGPLNLTAPNGGETATGGASYTVTWTVNGTDAHCMDVDILISTDGGASYTVVQSLTPNDGTESITMPNVTTSTARAIVRCHVAGGFQSASTFFDVSNANFTITASAGCAPVVNVSTNPTPSGTYKASNTVNSMLPIDNNSNVNFEAGTTICLDNGFEIPASTVFNAVIQNCTP